MSEEAAKATEPTEVDLIICTPGNAVQKGYLLSLLELINYLNTHAISWTYSIQSSSHVGDAREATLEGGFDSQLDESRPFKGNLKYKKILWIDSDITFTVDDFLKLWESDKDIVSGMYLLQTGVTATHVNELGRPLVYDEAKELTEPFKVWGSGFGFIMIKQGVFETLSRPWFQSSPSSKTFDDGRTFNFQILGEDLSFCDRIAKESNFEVWTDPNVQLTHTKQMKLTWKGIEA